LRDRGLRLGTLERLLSRRRRRRARSDGPDRVAYRLGETQLNVPGPGAEPSELARVPVQPGNSDLCIVWSGPIADALRHLREHGVKIESGPVERFGAGGQGDSVYFRDPDGSLLEFISYEGWI